MKQILKFSALALLVAGPVHGDNGAGPVQAGATHPEARPFIQTSNANLDVDQGLARAKANGRHVLIVFGGNWCHDSRALAGWFATPRFQALLARHYELVYVDVGMKDRNLDVARRFGLRKIKGTPTMLLLSTEGRVLNKKSAGNWRNASLMSEDDIFAALEGFMK